MGNRLCNRLLTGAVIALFAGACSGSMKDSAGVVVSAVITPTYNGAATASVDAFQSTCQNTTDGTLQAETFADHGATASINASLINPSNTIKQTTVTIDRYTISYGGRADSPGAPPIQSDTRERTVTFTVTGEDVASAELSAAFLDLLRKEQYGGDVTSGIYSSGSAFLNNYTATYTFFGHGENGVPFSFSSKTDFQIGSFNNCPAGFEPI